MTLSKTSLLTIYKSFSKPLLDYADILYDKPVSESFKSKIEVVQYNASLVIIGGTRGTSRETLYHELDLESLNDFRWSCKLFFLPKIVSGFTPLYLQEMLSSHYKPYYQARSKSVNSIEQLMAMANTFESSYFRHYTKERFNLSEDIRFEKSAKMFKKVFVGLKVFQVVSCIQNIFDYIQSVTKCCVTESEVSIIQKVFITLIENVFISVRFFFLWMYNYWCSFSIHLQ